MGADQWRFLRGMIVGHVDLIAPAESDPLTDRCRLAMWSAGATVVL